MGDNEHLGDNINYSIFMTDSALNIKKKGFRREHGKYSNIWIPENFYRNRDHTYFHPLFSDTTYNITSDGSIIPRFHIDFGKRSLPEKYTLENNWEDFKKESVQSKYYIFPGKSFETDNWLFLEFLTNHESGYVLFDKKNNRTIKGKYIKNDIGMKLPIATIIGSFKNNIIASITPDILVQAWESLPENKKSTVFTKEASELIISLKEEDNPILLLITMK